MMLCCSSVTLAFAPVNYRRYRTCMYDNIEKSLENARKNLIEGKSPGAGLATAGMCLVYYAQLLSISFQLLFR